MIQHIGSLERLPLPAMVVDHSALTDEVDNFDEITTEQRARARRTVAAHSVDADECREFMAMLGIAPEQERDEVPEVARPKLPRSTPQRRKPSLKRA